MRLIDADALWNRLELGPEREDFHVSLRAARRGIEEAPTLSLNTLRDAIYEDAVAHGLWEDYDQKLRRDIDFCAQYAEYAFDVDVECRLQCAMCVCSECVELREARDDADAFTEELADVIIMSMSVAGKLGIDIDAAIRRKMEINKKRPWKHEGEKK